MTATGTAFPIAACPAGGTGGMIGLAFAPGTRPGSGCSRCPGTLAADLHAVAVWGAAAVVTLVEPAELTSLGIDGIGEGVRRRGLEWHHWSIADYAVPGPAFEAAWPARSAALRAMLDAGGRILIHCRGGLGRTGMVAARLLVEMGAEPDAAVAAVRAVRPGAIETPAQAHWVETGPPGGIGLAPPPPP